VTQLTNARVDSEGMKTEEEEAPHARGPDEIGMEDTGPQAAGSVGIGLQQGMQGIDVEAAVGRRAEGHEAATDDIGTMIPKREAEEQIDREPKRARDVDDEKEEGAREQNDDVALAVVDSDRKDDGEKVSEAAENIGADAAHASTV